VFVSQTTLFLGLNRLHNLKICVQRIMRAWFKVRFLYGDDVAKSPKTSPSRRPWASDDVRMLKSMARKEPASAIAKSLKRTEGATRQKATALGVSLNTTRGRAAAKPAAKKSTARKAAPKKAAAKKAAPKKSAKKSARRA
jgi:hypothetical protein